MRNIHIFTRDLRIEDNKCLNYNSKTFDGHVCGIFILNPTQYKNNKYKSSHILKFMKESVVDLNKAMKNKLTIFEGEPDEVVGIIIKHFHGIELNFSIMKDYTIFSRERNGKINKVLKEHKLQPLVEIEDNFLFSDVPDIKPYKQFTAFYNFVTKNHIEKNLNILKYSLKFLNVIEKLPLFRGLQFFVSSHQ